MVILGAMFVLGVMIAAIPEIDGEHATAFAVAYVVGRFLAGRPWQRATVVVDLPIVQMGAGIVPWIVSFWFEGTTQYVLWAVGLGARPAVHRLHEPRAGCSPAVTAPARAPTRPRAGPGPRTWRSTSATPTSRTSPSGSACSC